MSKLGSLLTALRGARTQQARIDELERQLIRMSPQLAALEQRVADLSARLDAPDFVADDAEKAEARRLVDEVRAEHARVRARISSAVVFEERLRVLEERAGTESGS